MADFNIDDYFAKLNRTITAEDGPDPVNDKYLALRIASEEKTRQLAQMSAMASRREAAIRETWAGKLGLDSQGPTGKVVDAAASLYSGATRGAGSLLAAPASLLAAANQNQLSEEDIGALNRFEQGTATHADRIQINRKIAPTAAPDPRLSPEVARARAAAQAVANQRAQEIADSDPNAPTPLSIWKEMNKARDVAGVITNAADNSAAIRANVRDAFTADLLAGYNAETPQIAKGWASLQSGDTASGSADLAAGVAKLLVSAGSAVLRNKEATVQYMIENAPQLFMGAAGNAGRLAQLTDNISTAASNYNKGIQDYQGQNGGALPPEDQRNRMALLAISHAAAEQVGDKIGLAATKMGVQAAEAATRTSFKAALKGTAAAIGEGFLSEAPTEAYQQWAEGQIIGKPATGAEIYTAGVIGGASGAGLSGGGRAVHEVAKLASQPSAPKPLADVVTSPDQARVQETAIATGDVSPLLDTASPNYAPDMAIAALVGHSQKEDTTPEQKQANAAKAAEIVSKLEDTRALYQEYLATPEERQAKLDRLNEDLASLDPSLPTAPEIREAYQRLIDITEADLKADPLTPEQTRHYQTELSKVDSQLQLAKDAQFNLDLVVNTPTDIASHVATLSQPVDANDPQAADAHRASAERVINLAMASPERLDPTVAVQLANNTANGLTELQRDYLRAFSESRIAANALRDMGGVKQEVLLGSPDNMGIAQYQSGMARAISNNDQIKADGLMTNLSKFVQSHTSKAAAVAEAMTRGMGTQVHYNARSQEWFIPKGNEVFTGTRAEVDAALRKNGGLAIRSADLVDNIAAEATALSKTQEELNAAYDLKFGNSSSPSTSTTEVNNVQNQSQQGSGTQASTQTTTDQATQQGGVSTTPASTGTPNAQPAGVVGSSTVEATGVATRGLLSAPPKAPNQRIGTVETAKLAGADLIIAPNLPNVGYAGSLGAAAKAEGKNYEPKTHTNLAGKTVLVSVPGGSKLFAGLTELISRTKQALEAGATVRTDVESEATSNYNRNGEGALRVALIDAGYVETPGEYYSSWSKSTQSTTNTEEANASSVKTKETEETQSTESSENTKTEVKSTTDEGKSTEVASTGSLSTLTQKSPEGTSYTKRNLVADFFTQSVGKVTDVSSRPLVAVKNFLSTAFTQTKIKEFLGMSEDSTLSDAQLAALSGFKKMVKQWLPIIQANLSSKGEARADYRYEDLMQFFVEQTPQGLNIEENLKIAIANAAFGFVAETATKPTVNTDEEINSILLREANSPVSEEERAALANIGTRENVIINSLGQKVLDALGLKANRDAPQDLSSRLTSAMGAHVMKLLLDTGMLVRNTLTGEELAEITGNEVRQEFENTKHKFLKLARDEKYKLHPMAEQIYTANRGSQGVLDKLFGVEGGLTDPSTAPINFVQKTIRNTRQMVPKFLAKIMQHENKQPNHLRMDLWQVHTQMSAERMLRIAGWTEIDPKKVQKTKRLALQAKNEGLERELANLQDYVEHTLSMTDDGLESAVYFPHTVWKQHRVGIGSNTVNPQSSKLQRQFFSRPTWSTTIDPKDNAQMEQFRLRVAEGFGIKTDKLSSEAALAQLDEKLKSPKIQAAIAVMRKIAAKETITEGDQDTLVEAVAEAGEKMHSLDALNALALESKDKPFTVTLVGEVDGVTNGPMLSHILLGAASSAKGLFSLINRGGFFENGNQHSQYNQWRGDTEAIHTDLYETTAGHMVRSINGFIAEGIVETRGRNKGKQVMTPAAVSSVSAALYAFTGILAAPNGAVLKAGRDIVKTPLTAMLFGSSIKKAISSMSDNFVESIYGEIEKSAAEKKGSMSAAQLVENINTLLRQGNAAPLPTNLTIADLMEGDFTKSQVKGIKSAFAAVIGTAVENTLSTDFKDFIERRGVLNSTAQVAFAVHNALYQSLRSQMINELIEKEKAKPGTGIAFKTSKAGQITPLHDLTVAQEQEVRDRLSKVAPVMHTYFSKQDDNLGAGLAVSKSGRRLSQSDTYSQTVNFGTKTPDGQASTKTHGYEQQDTDPGVAMTPMAIHSLDSAISHLAALMGEVLNIHDAHAAGIGTFKQTAQNLNQSTWKALLGYSPATEMADTLSRTIIALADMVTKGSLPPGSVEAVQAELGLMNKGEGADLRTTLENIRATAYAADKVKLQAMLMMKSIDQYALEGGNYLVTKEDLAEAQAKLDALVDEPSKQEMAALAVLEKAMNSSPAQSTESSESTQKQDAAEDLGQKLAEDPVTPPVKKSPFGELVSSGNEPAIQSDPELVEFFAKNPKTNLKSVVQFLVKHISSLPRNRISETQMAVLRIIGISLQLADLPFNYITATSKESDVLALPNESARGWYISQGNAHEVNILSPEFLNSGLTVETLLHEITHSILARIIEEELAKFKANPKYTSEALTLVQELLDLQAKAATYAQENGLATEFKSALSNIHEFLAYGMTNLDFQQKVLSQISMQSKRKSRQTAVVLGMKSFIDTLVGILFAGSKRTPQAISVNGLTVMVNNVSGLVFSARKADSKTGDLNLAMAATGQTDINAANAYSTFDIHESLEDATNPLPVAFNDQLRGLLGGIVDKLHGPFGAFKESMRKSEAGSPLEVWTKAIITGKAPFASLIDGSPLAGSAQESYVSAQVEATVRAALNNNEARTKMVYADLSKLYAEMYRTLNKDGREFHTGDWATATPSEKAQAQAKFNFVFELSKTNGDKMDHLARFAALGLANEKFNRVLQVSTEGKSNRLSQAKSWADRFQAVFENVLEYFHEKVTRTFKGQRADDKLAVLVEQLVDIEAKERSHVASSLYSKFSDPAEDAVRKFSDVVRGKVEDIAGSKFLRNNKNSFVRLAGTTARTIAGNRVDAVLEQIRKMREQNFAGIQGVAASLMQEYKGQDKMFQLMLRLAKVTEGNRKDRITSVGKSSLDAFANGGKDISGRSDRAKGIRKAISAIFMRTGAHNLMDHFSMAEIESLVGDSAARDAAINTFEQKLNGFGAFKNYFIAQANVLAAYKATGSVRGSYLLMNAHVISKMVGTRYANQITEAQASQAEDVIKVLVSLYSLGYSNATDLAYAKEIIASENTRTDGNGIEFVLDLHKHLEQDSLDRIFQGDKTQMIHGYTSEIYDPRVEITTANEVKGADLEAQGWVKGSRVSLDPADPNRELKHVYSLKDGGMTRRVTGMFSYSGKKAKGTSIHNGYMNVRTVAGLNNAATNAAIINSRQADINGMFRPMPRKDLSRPTTSFMAPVLNRDGDVVKWRYLMSETTKDDVLKRDNRFDKVMGTIAGSIFDKQTTQEQNLKAVQALKEHYDTDYKFNPKGYMLVGANSRDPEMKEIWKLLPEDTKRDVEEVWGYKGMMVRSDNLDIMFGYRKLSIAEVFAKDPELRKKWEQVVVAMAEAFFGQKAGLRMRQGERGWQEMVAEAKDIIVVKSGIVLLANVRSNMWLLHTMGVSLKDMLHHHLVALKGTTAYQKDTKELEHLRLLRDTKYTQGNSAEIDRKILLLEDSLARNPVKELIDAGLMPTIVEELDPEDDNYSYKSALSQKVQALTDKVHPALMKGAKFIYMAHDTPMYQGFRHVTQMSDFVARYVLYQHLISKKTDPLSKAEAIQEASDAFVNYDIPMHRILQYTDDMGITMFTKYFLRIQKVLAQTVRDNPGRVLTSTLLAHYLSLGPTVLEESSMWTHIGNNPIQDGPLKYLESLGELPAINSAMHVFSTGVSAPVVGAAAKAVGLPS